MAGGSHYVWAAFQIHCNPWIALVIRPEGVAEHRGTLIAQIVFVAIECRIPFAAFQQNHAQCGFREFLGDDAAWRARCCRHASLHRSGRSLLRFRRDPRR